MDEYAKRGYLLENFRLFHLRTEKTAQVDFHYHEFCKLLLLVSGQGAYAVDGQRYLLQPGDAVLIGSRSVHRPELDQNYAYERIIIYISPEFLRRESAEGCDLERIFSGERGHILRLEEPDRRKLVQLVSRLEQELSGDAYGRVILCNGMLLVISLFEAAKNGNMTAIREILSLLEKGSPDGQEVLIIDDISTE